MREACRGWIMPEEDARSMLAMIEEGIRSSGIQVEHRDVLIRLREMIEGDLAAFPDSSGEDDLQALERKPNPLRGSSLEATNPS